MGAPRRSAAPRPSPRCSPGARARHARRSSTAHAGGLAHRGQPKVVFAFTIADGTVTAIDLIADPDLLSDVEVTLLKG